MTDFILSYYNWFKACHVIAVIAWMAGMLYLPRLYVYHAGAAKGSTVSETFKIMERRLLRFIINPAMILSFVFGGLLVMANPALFQDGWLHVKLTAVILMVCVHILYARWRKVFEQDKNKRTPRFYKFWNEVPTVLMIIIVFMVVVKPF